jgi:hypothetical protein
VGQQENKQEVQEAGGVGHGTRSAFGRGFSVAGSAL